jgi:hypothetical protein
MNIKLSAIGIVKRERSSVSNRMRGGRISHKRLAFCTVGVSGALLCLGLDPASSDPPVSAAALATTPPVPSAEIANEIVREGTAGFIVSEIAYVLGPDAKDSGACPNGLSLGVKGLTDAASKSRSGRRHDGETDERYQTRLVAAVHKNSDGRNVCMYPELSKADPGWRTVSGRNIKVDGIDIDQGRGRLGGAKGTCEHEEFSGTNGQKGVDNQFYRVVGCTASFQSGGQANTWQIEMYTGSWGILLSLKDVNDLQKDSSVVVGIYASGDPIQLSADRRPLAFATYAMHENRQYRAETRGKIVNGVLTTVPVNIRVVNVTNGMLEDRILLDARLRLTFTSDGGMEGVLAGYTPVENMYDLQYGTRRGRDAAGRLAPERLRVGTAVGRAIVSGHTCNGAYHALYQAADGHRDPKTGRCTSISTQYRIRLAPAFVVETRTQSINAPLTLR